MTSASEYIPVNVGVIKYWKQRMTVTVDVLKLQHYRQHSPCNFKNEPINSFSRFRCNSLLLLSTKLNIPFNAMITNSVFVALLLLFISMPNFCFAQTETFDAGAYIVNMGITPQTEKNALKPYGMIYDLIKNHKVMVKWCINPAKSKDGTDFSHNGVNYKGGPFIIPAEYRSSAVNARINYWKSLGVVGATTVSSITVPIDPTYGTLRNVPRWTLDKKNGKLAVEYFMNAGIPQDAYGGNNGAGWKNPSELDCCDDLFVLPHAEPSWAVHQRLYSWNLECKGGLWDGCTSGSAIENMVNPSDRNQQTNFLTVKDPAFKGTSGIYANSNTLMLWGTHKDGTPPYTHRLPADPVAQYIGTTDGAHTNGAEQIYIPRQTSGTAARWNPGTKIIVYDPSHTNVPSIQPDLRNAPAAIVYGRGFGDENRGFVMHSAGHSYDKCQSSPAHVAAQRAFFNFSWLVATDKAEVISIVNNGGNVSSGTGRGISFDLPEGNLSSFTIEWSSTCGGTFTPSPNQQTLEFIPPPSTDISGCVLSVTITDGCGRVTTSSQRIGIFCDYYVNHTKEHPTCKGNQNGVIHLDISGSSAYGANDWSWTKDNSPTTGSGTGQTISGLGAGSYQITVTSFTGCSAAFTTLLTEPNEIGVAAQAQNYQCYDQKGAVTIVNSGGSTPFSYLWSNGSTTKNLANITFGQYTITVTDANGCTGSAAASVAGPLTSFTVSASKTDVSCFGQQNGTINLSVTGGQPDYSYLWSDGQGQKDLINLSAGNYVVTVSDVYGCTATTSAVIQQPTPLNVIVNTTPPDCDVGSNSSLITNGAIDISVSGATPPYLYVWNSGATTQDRLSLSAGNYTVTVTDAKGCQSVKEITLTSLSTIPSNPTGIHK